jgi:hypothetical protein
MSDDYRFIKTETETIIHHVITCVICGRRIDELSEKSALHMADQTGRVKSRPHARGLVWLCDCCLDDPQAALFE